MFLVVLIGGWKDLSSGLTKETKKNGKEIKKIRKKRERKMANKTINVILTKTYLDSLNQIKNPELRIRIEKKE